MILIFTNKEDVHPTPVIEKLNGMGIPVFRFNTECLLTDYRFRWWCETKDCGFTITNIKNGLTLESSNLTAVWDRRPEYPDELPVVNTKEVNKFNKEEAMGFFRFLRGYLSRVPSIGSIANDGMASSKMLQLSIAQSVGFNSPATCLSNRKADIVDFASKYEYVALKLIGAESIIHEDGSQHAFFTQKATCKSLMEVPDEAFIQTANFVQEYIPKSYELRVTVVCDKVFSCRIDSQQLGEEDGAVDWRQGYDKGLKHSVYNLPDDVSRKCIAYLREMKLNFGAFDFVVTPSGEYVFLECNPNGQWLWIEIETGLKISDAIAEALHHPELLTNK